MDAVSPPNSGWNTRQAYFIAAVCFALGVIMGYLLRTPSPAPLASAPQAPQKRAAAPAPSQPSPEQLQHMADKQAEPLLARLQQNPKDAAVLAELGKTYLYVRDFQRSTDYYERSVNIKPDPRVLTTLGGAYHLAGADDKAIDAWQRALKVDPAYADALYNIGLVKWQVESDPAGAIKVWNTLLKTNPNHPQRAQIEEMIARARQHLNMKPGAPAGKPTI